MEVDRKTMLQRLAELGDSELARMARTYASIGGPRHRVDLVATGIDESLQGRTPAQSWEGLRVPFAFAQPPSEEVPLGVGNYLFLSNYFEVGEGERKRITRIALLHKIGLDQNAVAGAAQIPNELFVRTPTWRFRDGFVSYHLRELTPTAYKRIRQNAGIQDTNNLAFRICKSPALLYETISFPVAHIGADGKPDYYVFLNGYVPPNGGQPYGDDVAGLGNIYDASRFAYNRDIETDIEVEGGDGGTVIAMFIRVRQTNPATRPIVPAVPTITTGISQEEQFLLDYPAAIEWRVGSSLTVEDI